MAHNRSVSEIWRVEADATNCTVPEMVLPPSVAAGEVVLSALQTLDGDPACINHIELSKRFLFF